MPKLDSESSNFGSSGSSAECHICSETSAKLTRKSHSTANSFARRRTALSLMALCLIIVAGLTLCFVVHHFGRSGNQPCISLSVNQSAINDCNGGRRGLLQMAVAAAGVSAQQQPPCISDDGLMLTAADKPLGPLVCGDDPYDGPDCQRSGFMLTDSRDGIIALRTGIYATHSSVTFYDSDVTGYATLSITVNGDIRLDCSSHNAHTAAKNPFTVCALNGLFGLRRGDTVRFQVRSAGRKVNLHKPATHFSVYKLV